MKTVLKCRVDFSLPFDTASPEGFAEVLKLYSNVRELAVASGGELSPITSYARPQTVKDKPAPVQKPAPLIDNLPPEPILVDAGKLSE